MDRPLAIVHDMRIMQKEAYPSNRTAFASTGRAEIDCPKESTISINLEC
jgi:hypothetical protein